MLRKLTACVLALIIALSFSACGDTSQKTFSTDNFKKFVQDSKKKSKMSYNKTKKAYKSIFPKIKMK